MKRVLAFAFLLGACDAREQPDSNPQSVEPANAAALPNASPAAKAMVLPVPEDKAQLERLQAMGYTLHDDHLDPPGVASCPKMSENPVL